MDPEILTQLHSRPISQQQLALQVNAIYADLIVVEKECANMDQALLRTVQEIGPSRKISMDSAEWQSFLAHHEKVHTLSSQLNHTSND